MEGKSCFFIGHREASEEIYPALHTAVEQHILDMASQNLSLVTTADLTTLQHRQSKKPSVFTQR